MESIVTRCDVCGAVKGETNHWLVALISTQPEQPGIAFGPIDSEFEDEDLKTEHICGRECASKRFSQWLDIHK